MLNSNVEMPVGYLLTSMKLKVQLRRVGMSLVPQIFGLKSNYRTHFYVYTFHGNSSISTW